MLDIIMWALLAFFSAFGIVEFIKFVYTDFKTTENDFHLVVRGFDKENLEGVLRNAILATDCKSVILLVSAESEYTQRLHNVFPHIQIMTTEEYIHFLKK